MTGNRNGGIIFYCYCGNLDFGSRPDSMSNPRENLRRVVWRYCSVLVLAQNVRYLISHLLQGSMAVGDIAKNQTLSTLFNLYGDHRSLERWSSTSEDH